MMNPASVWNAELAQILRTSDIDEVWRYISHTLQNALDISSLSVIQYLGDTMPLVLFSHAADDPAGARITAYVQGAYLLDPFFHASLDGSLEGCYSLAELSPDDFREGEYYNTFFAAYGLMDEINVFFKTGDGKSVAISLGRETGLRKFEKDTRKVLEKVCDFLRVVVEQTSGKSEQRPGIIETQLRAGFHVDEVYYGNSTLLNFQLFDIERVEALKGPQGTLYGRNSTGGSVNFFSNRPSAEFEAGLDLGYANFEAYSAEGFVSGPLSETLSGRLSFNVTQQDGGPFTHPVLGEIGEQDRYALRGQLLWDVSEKLGTHLLVFGGQDDSEGNQYEGVPTFTNDAEFNICDPVISGDLELSDACSFDGEGAILRDDDDPYTLQKGLINRDEIDAFGVVFSADYDLGFATLTSISAYNNVDRKSQEDADGTVVRSIDVDYETDFEQFTEELHLSSPNYGRWVWTLGLFYSTDELETPRTETDAGDFDFRQNHAYILETDSFAAFWHNEFKLTERFFVTAGIRYTDEERSFNGGTINVDFGSGPTANGEFVASPGPLPGDFSDPAVFDEAYVDEEIGFNEVSWSVGASMDISDTVMVYAGISNGFKSGGFIGDITVQEILQEPYDEETLTAYELGLKPDLLDGALRWNTSLFYYDYEDAILALSVDGTGVVDSLLINENAADAEVYGVESEIWYAPTEDLDIKFGVTYLDTETEGIPTSPFNVQERLDGNELTYAPEFSANGLVRYQMLMADGWKGHAQFDFTTLSDHWGESDNINISKLDGYTLLNARVGVGSEADNWSVGVWCRNLTDKEYFIYVNNLQAFGSILRTPGIPRTYGVDVSLRF